MAKATTTGRRAARPAKTPQTDADVAARAKAWDEARASLEAAGKAGVEAQAEFDALPPDASDEARHEAQRKLDAAKAAVTAAEQAVANLALSDDPLPPAARSGDAKKSEGAGGRIPASAPAAQPGPQDDAALAAGAESPAATIRVTVIGPAKGLRRAGFHFNAVPQTIEVTATQKAAIEADPSLSLTDGGLPAGTARQSGRHLTLEELLGADGQPVAVKVLGPAKGRRRAGNQFGQQAVEINPSIEQLAQILGDPELAVTPA